MTRKLSILFLISILIPLLVYVFFYRSESIVIIGILQIALLLPVLYYLHSSLMEPLKKLTILFKEAGVSTASPVQVADHLTDEIEELYEAWKQLSEKLQGMMNQMQSNTSNLQKNMERGMEDLERFNRTMIGRELRMIELKEEVLRLKTRLGEKVDQVSLSTDRRINSINFTTFTPADMKNALLNVLEDFEKSKRILQQENKRDEAILTSLGEALLATDKTGIITIYNSLAEQMFGWTQKEALGKNIYTLLAMYYRNGNPVPQQDNPVYVALASGSKVATSIEDYLYFGRKNGEKFPVALTITPITLEPEYGSKEKKILGTIAIIRDTTREKEVDRMKTEFISLASHQLRTPLSAIRWYSEMLLDGDVGTLTPEQKELTENLYQSNIRMIALVNSLLNISRIESGRIIVDPAPTDLGKLVNEVIADVKPKLEEKHHKLIISIHGNLPLINIDPKLIRQVYQNLLTNAIKYTPENGEISIFISTKDGSIISQVTDTGYGIPLKEQQKVFQKFYRGENIVRVETEGTGLGLYLAKAIIESSHGKIWFKSDINKGTSFWFSIPLSGMIAKKGEVTLNT